MSGQRANRVVAQSESLALSRGAGQVLAFFALILPVVLLPVAAYAVDATIIASREAGLQAATAQAAETAAQRLDVTAIRSTGALVIDPSAASLVAVQTLAEAEPGARVDSSTIDRVAITLVTSEPVILPFNLFGGAVDVHARATARLVAGYQARV
jgi:Flp pilus assembly protein TadG